MARRGILLIETAGTTGRVALSLPDRPTAIRTLIAENRHARDLVPAIAELLKDAGLQAGDLEAVGVSIGPGGYTGLRVGIAAAKTLAFASGAALHAVPTFDWMVRTVPETARRCVLMADALKDQVYGEVFERTAEGGWKSVLPLSVRPRESLAEYGERDAVALVDSKLADKVQDAFPIVVIREGIDERVIFESLLERLRTGRYRVERAAELEPLYLRGSSAEENRKTGP